MIIRLTVFLVSIGYLISCSSPYSERLERIDQLMESDPEIALAELAQIQCGDLTPADSAYFTLLYTQAMIKCGIIVSSDSLISIAYDKYADNSSGDLKIRACFYKAKISFNKGDMMSAMRDAMMSYELAKEEKSPCWIARSSELIGDIFNNVYDYQQCEQYTLEAVENYQLCNKMVNHRYALCDLASVYLNEDRNEEALFLLDSLEGIVKKELPIDTALHEYIMMARYSALLKTGNADNLKAMAYDSLHYETSDEDLLDISVNTVLYDDNLDNAYASELLSDAYGMAEDKKQEIRVMYADYVRSMKMENFRRAAILADSLLTIQSDIARKMLNESVTCVQRDFYSAIAEYEKQRSRQVFYVLVVVIIAALIVTMLLILMYRLKIRAGKAELEANISSLIHLKEQSERIGSENHRLSIELKEKNCALVDLQDSMESKALAEKKYLTIIERLFREKWNTLNMLCNEYFEKGDSETTRGTILRSIEKELEKLRTKKNLNYIENAVNQYMGNIMSMLRKECPNFKEEEYIFLSLVYAGLSVRAVCLFMGIKYKLFYLRKSRLSRRIEESDAPHKELFLDKLS